MSKRSAKSKELKSKGFFRKAGEVIGTIGHEVVEGKNKVVKVSEAIVDGITSVITTAKEKAAKKTVRKVVKKSVKKVAKKVAKNKIAKKIAGATNKKASPKKAARKK